MSRRGIVEATSKKKKDNLVTWSNVTIPRAPAPPVSATGALLQGGATNYHFLFSPSARGKMTNPTTQVTVDDESTRASTVTYAKGYRERINIQTNSALPWSWRRIVFSMKGTLQYFNTGTGLAPQYLLTSSGYVRLVTEMSGSQTAVLQNLIFDGAQGIDWRDPLDAKTDSTIVTILSDQTRIFTPQTSSGLIKNFRVYYPLEKNIVYGEDEYGGEDPSNEWSTLGKPGMGDVLIYDYIAPKSGNTFSDQMSIDFQGTWYWHEK